MNLEELKRLHAAATQGEWVSNSCESSQRDYARITLAGKGSYVGDACENSDGACIAAIHNAFPAIVAKLEAAQRLRDALADCNDAWESLCPVNILAAFDKEIA